MKYNYRNSKGQWVSQDKVFKKFILTLAWYGIGPIAIGVMAHYAHSPVEVTQPVEAHTEAVEEYVPEVDVCELTTVVCENEQPAEDAIKAVSEAHGREVTDETKKRIRYLYDRATENNVPFFDAVKTIYCESQWYAIKSAYPGEESYGLSQIHVHSHKHVTVDEAMDAYFAIDFLVDNWFTPQAVADKMWFGYSRLTGTCTNGLSINL